MSIPAIGESDGSTPGIPVAFYGRTAPDVDAHAKIQRQLHVVKDALQADGHVVSLYVDVASRSGLNGSVVDTAGWRLDGHPVRGGMLALLRTASKAHRDLNEIACAGLDRVARQPVEYLHIKDELAIHGIHITTHDCRGIGDE